VSIAARYDSVKKMMPGLLCQALFIVEKAALVLCTVCSLCQLEGGGYLITLIIYDTSSKNEGRDTMTMIMNFLNKKLHAKSA
jgi:hypothetical protein